jgi:hypothetical protein
MRRSLPSVRLASRAVLVAALAGAGALTAASPASAKVLRAKLTDPSGDAARASADLTAATAKYDTTGRLRISITTAAALDLRIGGQLVVTFTGKSCGTDLFGVTADLTDPALPWVYRSRGKAAAAQPVNGSGALSGTTYSATVRTARLASLAPAGVQAAIYPPGTATDPLDQTDCITLR